MLSQDPEYVALKKTEQEIERKAKRDLDFEETRQKTRDYQMQRAKTSKGLDEIFSDPKEMLEFAEHTVRQYTALILFCSQRKLPPEQTLTDLMGSKEDYLKTAEEEGGVQNLDVYIGSCIESGLMCRKVEEETQRLQRKLDNYIANFKCSKCGANIGRFGVANNQLLCKNCESSYNVPCPKCGNRLLFNITGHILTGYHCPACKLSLRANYAHKNIE
jgi:DNA-directed RNA polymerase subunit RPC12/RpoP